MDASIRANKPRPPIPSKPQNISLGSPKIELKRKPSPPYKKPKRTASFTGMAKKTHRVRHILSSNKVLHKSTLCLCSSHRKNVHFFKRRRQVAYLVSCNNNKNKPFVRYCCFRGHLNAAGRLAR